MEREEGLRRRDERDRLRRAQETDVQEKQAQVNNSGVLFCRQCLFVRQPDG